MPNAAVKKEDEASRPGPGEVAKRKLIEAGLKIFSDVGFQTATTRTIASMAGVNIAAIPYYFGSKEGLYCAVIDHVIAYFSGEYGGDIARIKVALKDKNTTADDYRTLLDSYLLTLLRIMLLPGKEREQISYLYIREQMDPTKAFDRLYDGFIHDAYDTTARLVGRVIGLNDSAPENKLIAQTLLGQISIFKLSQTTIRRNMGWKSYGQKELAEVEKIILSNVDAILEGYKKRGGR